MVHILVMQIYSEHKEEMKELKKGSSQKKGGGGRCCCERTEAVKELTR